MMKLASVCGIALALLSGTASAVTLTLAPTPAAVQVGDTFSLNVQVADVNDLYGFQFDLAFDPNVIQVRDVLEGSFLADRGVSTFFIPGTIDNTAGTVTFTANTLLGPGPGATGGGPLASLRFQALAVGQGNLSFGNVMLIDSALADIETTASAGAVTVSAVPEPASAVLFGVGLAVFARQLQRRRSGPERPGFSA